MTDHLSGYYCQDKKIGRHLVIVTGRKLNYKLSRGADPTYLYLVEKFTEFMRRYEKNYTCAGLSVDPINVYRPGIEVKNETEN